MSVKYLLSILLLASLSAVGQTDTIFRPELQGDSVIKRYMDRMDAAIGAMAAIHNFGQVDTTLVGNKATTEIRKFADYFEHYFSDKYDELFWYYRVGYFPSKYNRESIIEYLFDKATSPKSNEK